MVDFREISINDKACFDGYLKKYNPQISEMTFTNFFMWRNFYKFRFAEINEMLCVISVADNSSPFAFIPVGNVENIEVFHDTVEKLRQYFLSKGWTLEFRRVEENELGFFNGIIRPENIVFDRSSSDYVYLLSDLTHLSGKRFDGKRNHINKFKKLYTYEYVTLDSSNIEDCKRIMQDWCNERSCEDHKDLYCEKLANFEVLDNYEALGCKGALIKVNDRFEAFTVGETLNNDTVVIHIEKAKNAIHGLYTFINQQFCEKEWQNAVYVNREQDLGVEGLRKAKLSYNPVKMVNKYIVSFADGHR